MCRLWSSMPVHVVVATACGRLSPPHTTIHSRARARTYARTTHRYRMRVCVPSMCEPVDDDDDDDDDDDEYFYEDDDDDDEVDATIELDAATDVVSSIVAESPPKMAPESSGTSGVGTGSLAATSTDDDDDGGGGSGGGGGRRVGAPTKFFALRWSSVVTANSNALLWSYTAAPILALSE